MSAPGGVCGSVVVPTNMSSVNVETGPASNTCPVLLVSVARRWASGLSAGAVTWSSRAGRVNAVIVVRCGVPSPGTAVGRASRQDAATVPASGSASTGSASTTSAFSAAYARSRRAIGGGIGAAAAASTGTGGRWTSIHHGPARAPRS